jgi:hypothetical protein
MEEIKYNLLTYLPIPFSGASFAPDNNKYKQMKAWIWKYVISKMLDKEIKYN